MRYTYEPEVEAFREEVRQFIKENLPPEEVRLARGYEGGFKTYQEEYDYTMGFQKKLSEKGWLAMAWPKEYGGGGASHMRQLVYNEEMAYNQAPAGNMGIAWVGPSLMLYGTDEQKTKFIPRITGADDWWCTLYSEPGAGSDLAALQTRATRDGDEYVVNGQKIWTSGGHLSDWGWLAARTDPDAPKHKGITMFMVNMKSPGVTVRPLINMSDRHGFNEVFFEDVRVPANQVVGEVNRGWYHMAVALDFERSGIQSYAGGRRSVERLTRLAKEHPELVERRPSVRLRTGGPRGRYRGGYEPGVPGGDDAGSGAGAEPRGECFEVVRERNGPADLAHGHAPARDARAAQRRDEAPDHRPGDGLHELRQRDGGGGHERDPAGNHRHARPGPAAGVGDRG
ncbi:MAG: acyl-CoA dehydrogenase family protein [Dehalococcoidia bacterium]|nr:acyl-CoA dehydrogenase family protein [Dehalococcoidia bacterium]